MDFYFVLKKCMTLVMDLRHDTLIQRNINKTRIKKYNIEALLEDVCPLVRIRTSVNWFLNI